MRRILQTKFGAEEGNCFAACLASLFPVELEDVPDFYAEAGNAWYSAFVVWCRQFDVIPVMISLDSADPGLRGVYYLIGGMSPRGLMHSVIGLNGKMVHDPHPSGDGVLAVEDLTYFVKMFSGGE